MMKLFLVTTGRRILVVLLLALISDQSQAFMPQLCGIPKVQCPEYIQSALRNVNVTDGHTNSNTASLAFIIASAITTKYHVKINQKDIIDGLNENTHQSRLVTLLDIKRVINDLGFDVDAVQAEENADMSTFVNEILITQDRNKNIIALVASSESYVYFVYGVVANNALLYDVKKSNFMNAYTTRKFLILR